MSDAATNFWDSRYGERDRIWSGQPNHALVTALADVPPGRALDIGCGEGADSVWLGQHGWQVTALDISSTAIARGRSLADHHHVAEGQITWQGEDLERWQPDSCYDLVSACFLGSPIEFDRTGVLRRAASAVAPGGLLLIVGHAGPPPWASGHDRAKHVFLSPAEELDNLALDDTVWDVIISDVRPRSAIGPDGARAELDDTVLLVRHR